MPRNRIKRDLYKLNIECEYAAQSLNISTTNKTEICPIMWDGAVCWPPLDQLNTIGKKEFISFFKFIS